MNAPTISSGDITGEKTSDPGVLLGLFAAIGVSLAAIGLYGVISFLVAQRIGSLAATRWLRSLLYQVPARDPWTLAITVAVLLAVALLAAWFPSRRALSVDPLIALKQE